MNRSIRSHSRAASPGFEARSSRRLLAHTSRDVHRTGPPIGLRAQRPMATYFELLMSLPAKRTLSQLLHA